MVSSSNIEGEDDDIVRNDGRRGFPRIYTVEKLTAMGCNCVCVVLLGDTPAPVIGRSIGSKRTTVMTWRPVIRAWTEREVIGRSIGSKKSTVMTWHAGIGCLQVSPF